MVAKEGKNDLKKIRTLGFVGPQDSLFGIQLRQRRFAAFWPLFCHSRTKRRIVSILGAKRWIHDFPRHFQKRKIRFIPSTSTWLGFFCLPPEVGHSRISCHYNSVASGGLASTQWCASMLPAPRFWHASSAAQSGGIHYKLATPTTSAATVSSLLFLISSERPSLSSHVAKRFAYRKTFARTPSLGPFWGSMTKLTYRTVLRSLHTETNDLLSVLVCRLRKRTFYCMYGPQRHVEWH